MSEHDVVKVRLRLRSEGGTPADESLQARPVEVPDRCGTYRLENHAFMTALAAGDVVRAEPDHSGELQVVDVVEPAPAVLTLVGRVWGAAMDLEPVLDRWRSAGARWTEGSAAALATVWADGMSPEDVLDVLQPELAAGTLELLEVSLPEHRTRDALAEDVDFDLATDLRS